jgi:hypothetical protein
MVYRSFLEVLAGSHPPRYTASLKPSSPRSGHSSTVRHDALICGAAAGYGSPRHRKVEVLTQAIDALAEELTGDPEFYWNKPAKGHSA